MDTSSSSNQDTITDTQETQGENQQQQVEELEAQLQGARQEHMRLLAEMDNQRKRVAKEVENVRKYAAEKLLTDLLSVRDSLEAALQVDTQNAQKLREGNELILRMLLKALDNSGLTVIDPVGQPFNPEAHQAMSMIASTEHEPGIVMEVLQKGYFLHDRLLRPAMVVVATETVNA